MTNKCMCVVKRCLCVFVFVVFVAVVRILVFCRHQWCDRYCYSKFAVWEVIREEEFSPLKNAEGAAKDTPTTCRKDLCSLHYRYALAAGAEFVRQDGAPFIDMQR